MHSILQIQQLSKTFKGSNVPAVSEITLAVEEGKIMAIVGESGSGKTTLIRMVAGFETPSAGNIYFDAACLVSPNCFVEPEDRGMGMVFQDLALFPHLTVKRNLLFGVKDKSYRTPAYVQKLLSLVGLSGLENRYPHEISGGQVQRIALARALASKPKLLLLDEPFNNLDIRIKNSLVREIREIIKQTNTTALFITHEKSEAFMMADQIAVLREGQLQQCSSPEEIYARPANTYVAEFFGQANHIPAEIQADGVHTPLGVFSRRMLLEDFSEGPTNGFLVHRPWDVVIQPDTGGTSVCISHSFFFGDHQEVYFTVPGSEGQEYKMFTHRDQSFATGDKIRIRITESNLTFCPE